MGAPELYSKWSKGEIRNCFELAGGSTYRRFELPGVDCILKNNNNKISKKKKKTSKIIQNNDEKKKEEERKIKG